MTTALFENLDQTVEQAGQTIEQTTLSQTSPKGYAAMLTSFLTILGAAGDGGNLAKALKLANGDNPIMAQLAIVWLWKHGCGHFQMRDIYWRQDHNPALLIIRVKE